MKTDVCLKSPYVIIQSVKVKRAILPIKATWERKFVITINLRLEEIAEIPQKYPTSNYWL